MQPLVLAASIIRVRTESTRLHDSTTKASDNITSTNWSNRKNNQIDRLDVTWHSNNIDQRFPKYAPPGGPCCLYENLSLTKYGETFLISCAW